MEGKKRRLAAIMFTDIVGYSKFMVEDELHGRLIRNRHKNIFEKYTSAYRGQVIQYFGDGTLSVFESAIAAVECAISMQKAFQSEPKVPLRIGIHLGDILFDETEAFGHGVNVAARIEPICNPGGILISDKIYDEIKNQSTIQASPLGLFRFRNMEQEIGLFAVDEEGVAFPDANERAFMKEVSQKMHMATVAERSDAMKDFLSTGKTQRRKKGLSLMISFFLILALGFSMNYFKSHRQWSNLSPYDGIVSIAVLPFINMNGTEENEYFSDGITEDILTLISKLNGFSVTSRTSIMQYKSTSKTMREIGRELGVGHLLEGSVRREGNKVRITAQLIDAERDEHVWAKTYDEELTSIFEVQSNVARDIAHQLRRSLSPLEREAMSTKPTENITAYEQYLKGRELYRMYTPEMNDSAIIHFKKALEYDPNYPSAFAGLGDAYAQKAFHGQMDEHLLDSAEIWSKKAVELDPKLSEGFKALGLVNHYKGKLDEALTAYNRAIKLDPYNDMASNNIGHIEISKGNFVEGVKWAEHTLSINKNIPTSSSNLANIYYQLGDDTKAERIIEEGMAINKESQELMEIKGQILLRKEQSVEARKEAEKILARNPKSKAGYILLSESYMKEKEFEKALVEIDKAKIQIPELGMVQAWNLQAMSAFVQSKLGHHEKARVEWEAILSAMEEVDPEKSKAIKGLDIFKGIVYAGLGENQKALDYIKKAKNENWLNYKEAMTHPMFDNLRQIKEFEQIISEAKIKADSIKQKLPQITP